MRCLIFSIPTSIVYGAFFLLFINDLGCISWTGCILSMDDVFVAMDELHTYCGPDGGSYGRTAYLLTWMPSDVFIDGIQVESGAID